jgi:hypothetical protein
MLKTPLFILSDLAVFDLPSASQKRLWEKVSRLRRETQNGFWIILMVGVFWAKSEKFLLLGQPPKGVLAIAWQAFY